MEKSDKQLLTEFLAGSDASFEQLVQRYLKPIYNFLYQFTKDKDTLDDLTQETFVKAWKNLEKFDRKKNFKTWLYTIAKNTAYDYLKKKKTVPFSFFENEAGNNHLENIPEENPLPDEIVFRKDLEKDLEKKLQALPDNYRILLMMRYKDDFSLQEIAEILNLPYNTVKSQHARALVNLKKTF